ncbi:uncharacterized protein LOC120422485 [Culex pipiens pallens]|uniref:uncharacterized protein LOC120422485 n=1 Tax=Culex pipiens pallens TaxID=42434 RepID=UPI00195463E6|nr:uncharacterized protein LOC120422485 [Culex pipiens pallens]
MSSSMNATQSAVYRVNTDRTLFEFVSEQKNALAGSIAGVPVDEVLYQIDLALSFMRYYMDQEDDGLLDEPNSKHRVVLDSRKSVFEILLDLHSAMRATCVGFELYVVGGDLAKDEFVKKLLEFPNFSSGAEVLSIANSNLAVAYCTMIVFESSDLESATDVLAKAWVNCSVPWTVRNVLVQETVQEKFILLLESKLKPFLDNVPYEKEMRAAVNKASETGFRMIQCLVDGVELKPTVVYGANVDFFLEKESTRASPILTLNAFRTAKEAITLANTSNGGSVSLWTEELSLALEVAYAVAAQSVWVNCHAVFNPAFPYTFRAHDYCYGSEYAICEKKIKTVFVPSIEQPVNSTEKNKAAIDGLGLVSKEVKSQRFSFVKNEKNVHYEMVSSEYKLDNYNPEQRLQIVDEFWSKFVTIDTADRNLVHDTVYNQRKTVVIPYGVTFAN